MTDDSGDDSSDVDNEDTNVQEWHSDLEQHVSLSAKRPLQRLLFRPSV